MLLTEVGALVMGGTEKVKLLNAFFVSVLAEKPENNLNKVHLLLRHLNIYVNLLVCLLLE